MKNETLQIYEVPVRLELADWLHWLEGTRSQIKKQASLGTALPYRWWSPRHQGPTGGSKGARGCQSIIVQSVLHARQAILSFMFKSCLICVTAFPFCGGVLSNEKNTHGVWNLKTWFLVPALPNTVTCCFPEPSFSDMYNAGQQFVLNQLLSQNMGKHHLPHNHLGWTQILGPIHFDSLWARKPWKLLWNPLPKWFLYTFNF